MPPAQAEPVELNLLRPWREPMSFRRLFRDGLGSIVVHAAVITALWLAPNVEPSRDAPVIAADLKRSAVKIFAPPPEPKFFEPTQTAPNRGKVTRELDVRSAEEGTQAQARRYRPPAPAAGIPQPAAAAVVESPHVDLPQIEGPKPEPAIQSSLRLPPLPATAKNAPETKRGIPPPPSGAGITVGDLGEDQPSIPGLNQTPSPCQACSSLQLLSDPQNVDFQPYLLQLLKVVKKNWMTVIPEAARTGRPGRVLIRFVIDRSGVISNLTISSPSGTGAFDRAAVVGMSMSNPFPPLPAGYKGDQIRLQMAFAYNSAR